MIYKLGLKIVKRGSDTMEKRKEKSAGWIPKILKKEDEYDDYDEEYDDEYEDDYEELEEKIELLTKENATVKAKLMDCVKALREISSQKDQLESQLGQEKALPQHYQTLEKKVIDYRSKILESNQIIEQLKVQLEEERTAKKAEAPLLEKHLAQSKEQLSQLTTLNTQLEKRVQNLTEEVLGTSQEVSKNKELTALVTQLKEEKMVKEEEYEIQIKHLRSELAEWKTELSQKQHENEQLTNQLFDEQTTHYRGKEFENQLIQAKERIQKLVLENEQLRSSMEGSKSEIADVMIEAKIQSKQMLDQAHVEAARIHNKTKLELQQHNREAKVLVNQVDRIQMESEILFTQLKERLTLLTRDEKEQLEISQQKKELMIRDLEEKLARAESYLLEDIKVEKEAKRNGEYVKNRKIKIALEEYDALYSKVKYLEHTWRVNQELVVRKEKLTITDSELRYEKEEIIQIKQTAKEVELFVIMDTFRK